MMPTDHQQKAELDERKEMCAARDARRLVCDARWDSGGVRAKALASWANCNVTMAKDNGWRMCRLHRV